MEQKLLIRNIVGREILELRAAMPFVRVDAVNGFNIRNLGVGVTLFLLGFGDDPAAGFHFKALNDLLRDERIRRKCLSAAARRAQGAVSFGIEHEDAFDDEFLRRGNRGRFRGGSVRLFLRFLFAHYFCL